MKSDGYTFIEIILAMGILSLLLWAILPQVRQLQRGGTLRFGRITEKTAVTGLVRTLTADLSQVRWVPWQNAPAMEREGNETRIIWIDEGGEERTYTVTQNPKGVSIARDGEESGRLYPIPTLQSFSLEETGENGETRLEIRIVTEHQDLILPLRFGSQAMVIYEAP